jgi:hypothetical protein
MPRDETWTALETAAVRVAPDMIPQNLSNLVWGFLTFGRMPRDETWAALESASVRLARVMNEQDVANLFWGYATLGRLPGDETWAALEAAAGRVARDMNEQGLANTLWGYATLSTLRVVELPSCYAAVWELVCRLEARDFIAEQLRMLFHAHLMHNYSDASRSMNVSYPAWLMKEACDSWMRDVRDDDTTSRSHRELASVFDEFRLASVYAQ